MEVGEVLAAVITSYSIHYTKLYEVSFPVVSDRTFKLHRALRAGPTPFSLYVLRDRPGESGVIAGTHLGEDHDMAALFAYLKDLLGMPTSEFAALAPASYNFV